MLGLDGHLFATDSLVSVYLAQSGKILITRPMARPDRLFEILQLLRGGAVHRANDLARRLGVSPRTLYRDMARLAANGVPVTGTPGAGYRLRDETVLPPLSLDQAELEALNLGIAIVAEADDPDLKAAAARLADKLDAALPLDGGQVPVPIPAEAAPFASMARGFGHMAMLRAAIRARQKVELTEAAGNVPWVIHPHALDYLGRVWTLRGWSETHARSRAVRLDTIVQARALPAFFSGSSEADATGGAA